MELTFSASFTWIGFQETKASHFQCFLQFYELILVISISDSNGIRTHNHLVYKRTLNQMIDQMIEL